MFSVSEKKKLGKKAIISKILPYSSLRSKLREITGDIKVKTNNSTYTRKRLENTVQEYPKSKNYFFLSTISFPLTLIHIFFV